MSLTEYVADFAHGLEHEDIPQSVRETAIEHILDGYGLALSGHAEEGHRIMRRYAERVACAGEVLVLGTSIRSSAEVAALVNGLAMHAMDYDDTQLSTNRDSVYGLLTHPTTPVLGAASAAAELVGAGGRDLLTAYVAGVEVACRTADASNPRHYNSGFHSTGTFGAIGAAVAAGRLMGLTREQMRHALGIAAPLGGGYRENFGTMTKPLHAGQAAEAGVFAARLAADGFTAATNILEAKRGLYNASSDGYEPSRIEGRLGKPFFFEDPGISIKPYPSGSLSHPGQDAVLELVREHDVRPEDVEEAVAGTNSAMPNALIYAMPQTALEAKFSFPFLPGNRHSAAQGGHRRVPRRGSPEHGSSGDDEALSARSRSRDRGSRLPAPRHPHHHSPQRRPGAGESRVGGDRSSPKADEPGAAGSEILRVRRACNQRRTGPPGGGYDLGPGEPRASGGPS